MNMLCVCTLQSAKEVLTHFHAAQRNMVYAETKMNKHSSRSHAVLQVLTSRCYVPHSLQPMHARRYACTDTHAHTNTKCTHDGMISQEGPTVALGL